MIILAEAIKDPAIMTASEINKELDVLGKKLSDMNQAFIDAGRGHERPSDWAHKTDPLSVKQNAATDRYLALHGEIERRYGPGAPSRLPSGRGFGPVRR
jgi:hypothetical protein